MSRRSLYRVLLLAWFASPATAQHLTPAPGQDMNPFLELDLMMEHAERQNRHNELGSPSSSVSRFDMKAPAAARREYDKGLKLLMQKNEKSALPHLAKAIEIYPDFVSAHNALGSAYLDLGQNEEARNEFARVVSLDDHLPRAHWNLGRAELALRQYSAAVGSIQKASAIEPLNLNVRLALAYAQFLNQDYGGTIATAQELHTRKHQGAAMVHYLAAAAWQAQNRYSDSVNELQSFLDEDPTSPAADLVRQTMKQMQDKEHQAATPAVTISYGPSVDIPTGQLTLRGRNTLQKLREQQEVAEAECDDCGAASSASLAIAGDSRSGRIGGGSASPYDSGFILRSAVDEVNVLFAATDHGRSITDLQKSDVSIRDGGKTPAVITSFRNEAQLPLRMGLLIDTSASITRRFTFEQGAAASFLDKIITTRNDLGFVIGFANTILLVQDLTADKKQLSNGIAQLAPGGGTSLWDAVVFAANKLGHRPEEKHVANILVVISDGEDNSSSATLKEAIESAQRAETAIYVVSTKAFDPQDETSSVGNGALKLLSERTGGAAFFPESISHLKGSLAELQEVIRSRYMVSYKPAQFVRNGQYRTIEIMAEKSGRKLHVYARKGYYAEASRGQESAVR